MTRWFAQRRQTWIADMLHVYGFINGWHLQRKFSISEPQASKDLQVFIRSHPTAMHYDIAQRCYVRGDAMVRRDGNTTDQETRTGADARNRRHADHGR